MTGALAPAYLKPFVSIIDPAYGGKADGRRVTDAAITSGLAVLTSATAVFTAADVGKIVFVEGAGASAGTLQTTISAFTNATTVTVAATAGTTVSNARAEYGSNDKAAIDVALTAAASLGVNVRLPGGRMTFSSGGHVGVPGVRLEGAGLTLTKVRHTGNNVFYKYTEGTSPQGSNAGGAGDFTLLGNPGASAIGIQVSDCFGCKLRRITVGNRPVSATGRGDFDCYNNGGVAFLLQNETYWTEGTVLDECGSMFNDVGLRFQNLTNADPTKNNSFAYTKMMDFFCQVPTNGTGIDFGGTLGDTNPILVYHSELVAHIWGSQSASQVNNVCILVRKAAQIPPITRASIKGEVIGGSGNIWIRNTGDGSTGGKFNPSGHVRVWRDTGCTDDLQAASETLLHQSANAPLALDPSAGVAGVVGLKDSGGGAWRQTSALSGATAKTNEEAWFTAGYSFTGAPIHRFLALSAVAAMRGPFDVDAATKAWVRADGALCIGTLADRRIISMGSADPEASVTGSRGDLYLRKINTGQSIYVKTTGDATNTGWVNIGGLKNTTTWDPASVLTGAVTAAKTITVTGAAVGDFAQASFSAALPAGCFLVAEVTAANTVSVYLVNLSGSTQDVASGTVGARVIKAT